MKWLERILGGGSAEPTAATGDPARIAEIEAVLARVAATLAADGGHVRVAAVESDGSIVLVFGGACRACSAQAETLRAGIEPRLRAELAWVREVRAAP